jgi:hypothetical protein
MLMVSLAADFTAFELEAGTWSIKSTLSHLATLDTLRLQQQVCTHVYLLEAA